VDLAPFGVNRAPVIIVLSLPFLYRPALISTLSNFDL
jgi:hypothetical protein